MSYPISDVAIIGAGTAGTHLAHLLRTQGVSAILLEKSRGLGGRCSRRSIEGMSVDLGATFFQLAESMQAPWLDTLEQSGQLQRWRFSQAVFTPQAHAEVQEAWCGVPSLNRLHRYLAGDTECLTQSRVAQLSRADGEWQLLDEQGQIIAVANRVVITAPYEQTMALVPSDQKLHETLESSGCVNLPAYVSVVRFQQPVEGLFDHYQGGHLILERAVCESAKPLRADGDGQWWVLQSTAAWALEQDHAPAAEVAEQLRDAFCERFGIDKASGEVVSAHYWRLADHAGGQFPSPFLWDAENGLGCCADWLAGGSVSGALQSSYALYQVMK